MVSGDTVEGYLDSPNDVDIFRIPITDTRLIDVTLTSEESGVEIALLDSNGNVLDTAVTASQARLQATAQGGDFFVRVRAVSSTLKSKLQQGAKAFDLVVKVVKNVQSVINILQENWKSMWRLAGLGERSTWESISSSRRKYGARVQGKTLVRSSVGHVGSGCTENLRCSRRDAWTAQVYGRGKCLRSAFL